MSNGTSLKPPYISTQPFARCSVPSPHVDVASTPLSCSRRRVIATIDSDWATTRQSFVSQASLASTCRPTKVTHRGRVGFQTSTFTTITRSGNPQQSARRERVALGVCGLAHFCARLLHYPRALMRCEGEYVDDIEARAHAPNVSLRASRPWPSCGLSV